MTFDLRQRPLFAALCLSLALHLLVLFAGEVARPAPTGVENVASQLQVLVRAGAVPVATPAPTPAKKSHVAPLPVARTQQSEQAVAPSAPQAPSTPAALSAGPSPVPAAVPPLAAGGEAQGSLDGASVASVAAGTVSADGLRQYRIDLAGAARRFRGYPALARSRGWEGVTEMTVFVDVAGVPAVRMTGSSGHAVLDEQALEMMGRAVAQTPLPEILRGRSFSVPLPIRFSLEE